MLIIGFGKLAKMIVNVHPDKPLPVYNRTKQHVEEDTNAYYVPTESFSEYMNAIIALPEEATLSFLEAHIHEFPKQAAIYITSTSIQTEEIADQYPDYNIVSSKFAGHALQSDLEKSGGTFVIPPAFLKEKKYIEKWLKDAFHVVHGEEADVLEANQTAVEETVELILQLEKKLKEKNIPEPIRTAVMKQIPAGVIHAHIRGEHGGFVKKIWKQKEEEYED